MQRRRLKNRAELARCRFQASVEIVDQARTLSDAAARLFSGDSRLSEVDLSYKNHGEVELLGLLDALLDRPNIITSLRLGHNVLTDAVVGKLSHYLAVSTTIERLYLFNCRISDAGHQALAWSLRINASLQRLHTYGCVVVDRAACDQAYVAALHVGPRRPAQSEWQLYDGHVSSFECDFRRLSAVAAQLPHPTMQALLLAPAVFVELALGPFSPGVGSAPASSISFDDADGAPVLLAFEDGAPDWPSDWPPATDADATWPQLSSPAKSNSDEPDDFFGNDDDDDDSAEELTGDVDVFFECAQPSGPYSQFVLRLPCTTTCGEVAALVAGRLSLAEQQRVHLTDASGLLPCRCNEPVSAMALERVAIKLLYDVLPADVGDDQLLPITLSMRNQRAQIVQSVRVHVVRTANVCDVVSAALSRTQPGIFHASARAAFRLLAIRAGSVERLFADAEPATELLAHSGLAVDQLERSPNDGERLVRALHVAAPLVHNDGSRFGVPFLQLVHSEDSAHTLLQRVRRRLGVAPRYSARYRLAVVDPTSRAVLPLADDHRMADCDFTHCLLAVFCCLADQPSADDMTAVVRHVLCWTASTAHQYIPV